VRACAADDIDLATCDLDESSSRQARHTFRYKSLCKLAIGEAVDLGVGDLDLPELRHSTLPVDDSTSIEVVRRQFHRDPVARADPDPVPTHLPARIAEHRVSVVERDAEDAVTKRLDDFAFQLDLFFLWRDQRLPNSVVPIIVTTSSTTSANA
jgi:hypothetical protein